MQAVRELPLKKVPGVAESLDWARALMILHESKLDKQIVRETLGCFLKNDSDWERVERELEQGTLLT